MYNTEVIQIYMYADTSIYIATDALPVCDYLIHIYKCITISNK